MRSTSSNMSDPEEQRKCFNYKNLQPLGGGKKIVPKVVSRPKNRLFYVLQKNKRD